MPPLSATATVIGVTTRRTDIDMDLLNMADVNAARGEKEHHIFGRIRHDEPVAVTEWGLAGSGEYHRSKRGIRDMAQPFERAVLLQSTANTTSARAHSEAESLREPQKSAVPGDWGENLLIEGGREWAANCICIGDEIEFVRAGAGVVLRLQVSSPRLPCGRVDEKHGKTFSKKGMRAECARTGIAGTFLRVLQPGSVCVGDVVRLVHRPHPEWDLTRVSRVLYGNDTAVMNYMLRARRSAPAVLADECVGSASEVQRLTEPPLPQSTPSELFAYRFPVA